jgi:cytochrome c oxidase cbb3-type subunit III
MAILRLLAIPVLVFSFYSLAWSAGAPPNGEGKRLYDYYCYQCHGYSGDARTEASQSLHPPPKDFTRTPRGQLTRRAMLNALKQGKPGTAMQSFSRVLTENQMYAVIAYVRETFMGPRDHKSPPKYRYHTPENGWKHHERQASAFPFVTGAISMDVSWEALTPAQRQGKRLFLSACVTCHEARPSGAQAGVIWKPRAVSFPRSKETCDGCHESIAYLRGTTFSEPRPAHGALAASTPQAASPYSKHGALPPVANMTVRQSRGQVLFLKNCAFCHAADGSGKNWIGTFLEPHARDLAALASAQGMDADRLNQVIRNGIPGTSMPAWNHVLTPTQIADVIAYLKAAYPKAAERLMATPTQPEANRNSKRPSSPAVDSSPHPRSVKRDFVGHRDVITAPYWRSSSPN